MPRTETNLLQPGAESVDAISLLRADMDDVDGAFAKFWDVSHDDDLEARSAKGVAARAACQRTRDYLGLERAFVRALGSTVSDAALLRDMRAAQERALELCATIERADPSGPHYDPSVRVLGDFLLRHAAGEREGVFRYATASRVNLFELGAQLRSERAERAERAVATGSVAAH